MEGGILKTNIMKNTGLYFFIAFLIVTNGIQAQKSPSSGGVKAEKTERPPALLAIKESDLKEDLFILASDTMRGKRAGTLDELRAAAWLAQKAQEAGLKPAGDDGTFFQFFPLQRSKISEESFVRINEKPLVTWKEAWIVRPIEKKFDAPVVWLNSFADTTKNLKNKVVAMQLIPPSKLPAEDISLYVYRYAHAAIREQVENLQNTGATAIVLVADSVAESKIGFFGHGLEEGTYSLNRNNEDVKKSVPVILVSSNWASELKTKNAQISADLGVNNYVFPSVNVVAEAPGSDLSLKNEYVLFSGHHDHDGIGVAVEGDSIWNGADDNASVSVAMLAIGRAWVKEPGKRSALFVWHGAEERGLFGSRYFVENPMVPKTSIVAVLNADMIGRNEPDIAALLGAIPPHRNSEELVAMAMEANNELTKFNIDTSWDEADHPENWYFRSDHLPYAQADIPAIFFTTLLHPDYHTPEDEADRIDMAKLLRMTKWMYATGWKISNTEKAPALDKKQAVEKE